MSLSFMRVFRLFVDLSGEAHTFETFLWHRHDHRVELPALFEATSGPARVRLLGPHHFNRAVQIGAQSSVSDSDRVPTCWTV